MSKKSSRAVILEVGVAEILESGVSVTGLNQILRRSGFSKGAFYHHFSSKTELTEALIDDVLAVQLTKGWMRALERSKQPWSELKRLSNIAVGNIFDGKGGYFELFLVLLHSRESLEDSCKLKLDNILNSWLSCTERALRTAYRNGELQSRLDERAWSWLLLGGLQSLRQLSKISEKKLEWKGVLRSLFVMLESANSQVLSKS